MASRQGWKEPVRLQHGGPSPPRHCLGYAARLGYSAVLLVWVRGILEWAIVSPTRGTWHLSSPTAIALMVFETADQVDC